VVLEPSRRAAGSEITLEWVENDMLATDYLNDPALEGYIFRDENSPADADDAARGYIAVKVYDKVREPAERHC
jgi:hypothetical protein